MEHDKREVERIEKACEAAMDMLEKAGVAVSLVLCSWETEEGRSAIMHGSRGNWYAVNGMMRYLLSRRENEPDVDVALGEDGADE
jgi:hypothetical protein